MKKLYSILILLALALSVYAQDARQRTVQTIVADVLAAMPAQNSADFTAQIGDLAKAAPQSVVEVASMLKPGRRHHEDQSCQRLEDRGFGH